jgi:hypothetical protein
MVSERKLKVWGGPAYGYRPRGVDIPFNRTPRGLVCAKTKKRAVELLAPVAHTSMREFNTRWTTTGNSVELAVATQEGVWINWTGNSWTKAKDFVRVV